MSTISKEQLIEKLQHRIAVAAKYPDLEEAQLDAAIFKIALASLEAEEPERNPVLAYADSYRDMAKQGVESIPVWSVITDLERNIAPLFTAPPAPVSVPAAMEIDDDFDSSFEHGKAVGWNAYRAAMLQSFGNSEQLNSPVIPDGWVACSEQMPEENAEQEVLACFKGGDISTLYYFEGRWDDAYGIVPIRQDVTHWMPLPAAPQQEAKNV
ncbi:hypothetical protein ASU64_16890 [Enterobacter hormaechei subsp. hoffmannii]|uniref:DUF551 domain-containing protein n=1 Tax=Enterobacter hormaechei TaxID=158836 RepID=UPI0007356D82|nr:DUF551 domain-containing protein [Enterobacter hormaechei]KTK35612.1 hypothetical protein ASU64_16890 [Enterobacter hormaechei subsp. hoffmannii]